MSRDESAFPQVTSDKWEDQPCVSSVWSEGGLTKREWLAGLAMQGLLSSIEDFRKGAMYHPEDVSGLSVQYADALLAELSKELEK